MPVRPMACRLVRPSALARVPIQIRVPQMMRAPCVQVCGVRASHSAHAPLRSASRGLWAAGAGAGLVAYLAMHDKMHSDEDKKEVQVHEPEEEKPQTLLRKTGRILFVYIIEPILVFQRFLVLAVIFAPVILASPMLLVGKVSEETSADGTERAGERWGALWWYGLLVAQMGRAGPTFVKLGQWAGSRHDLFPDALCDRLSKLHSNNNPHPFQHTKQVLERVFGKPFDEIFASFEHTPVGCGAVGQVYRAVLRDDLLPPDYLASKQEDKALAETAHKIGRELALTYEHDETEPRMPTAAVAIKVLHPHVHRTINYDIRIMRFFADTLNSLPGMRWVSLPEEVAQFSTLMFSQLDLRQEANNLARFERNFAARGSAVTFPRPLLDFCSRDVLIEEMIDAVPLKYFLQLGGLDYDTRIADLGLDAFLVRCYTDTEHAPDRQLYTRRSAPG